jgi:hypothetical protein
MSEQSDSLPDVARELLACARSWEPDVRVLGNVRAADIVRLCGEFAALDEEVGEQIESTARLRSLVRKYRDERDALMKLLVFRDAQLDASAGGLKYTWAAWLVSAIPTFERREDAVAAVRKAAGLDLVLGDPVPPTDGGADA